MPVLSPAWSTSVPVRYASTPISIPCTTNVAVHVHIPNVWRLSRDVDVRVSTFTRSGRHLQCPRGHPWIKSERSL
ncbi:hypothetical protein JTE90_023876 [Oedothorax gibbosus]|uniref:Uncharacterized protein n=1 Tax=Oedothorax gibbosus TaxID=931172 RepID=A0AAV6UNI3_9ARAC|nr:hypothetical protein JTE90_023876 [Oedothorax gibbosus]